MRAGDVVEPSMCHDGSVSAASPVEVEPTPTPDEITLLAVPWVTIVWNDPVNLMSYVTFVFQKYFGYAKKKAEKLMMEVHEDGKSVVSTGTREEMERDVQAMHEYGLWATMEKVGHDAASPGTAAAAGHRQLHRLRGRPAAVAGLPARRAAAQRGRRAAGRRRPARGAAGLLRPHLRARGPGAGAAVPDGVPRRRGGRRGVPALHRGRPARRQGRGGVHASSTRSRRPDSRPS